MGGNTSKSLSATLLEEGNELLSSEDENLAPVPQRSRLERILQKYKQALSVAQCQQEKIDANEGLAVVNAKLAKLVDPKNELQLVMHYLKKASDHFSNCHNLSDSFLHFFWRRRLRSSIHDFLEGINDFASPLSFQQQMSLLEAGTYSLQISSIRAEFCLKIAEKYFHESVCRASVKDFKSCLSRLRDCYRPISEIEKVQYYPGILRTLKEDIRYQTCWAESLQALETGMLKVYLQTFKYSTKLFVFDLCLKYTCFL